MLFNLVKCQVTFKLVQAQYATLGLNQDVGLLFQFSTLVLMYREVSLKQVKSMMQLNEERDPDRSHVTGSL